MPVGSVFPTGWLVPVPMKSVLPADIVLPVHPTGMDGALSLYGLLMLLKRTVHWSLFFQWV